MSALRVHDLMTKEPVTVDADEEIDLADQLMQLGRFRHVPVLDEGRLVGLITQRDLLRARAADAVTPPRYVKARELMTREVHAVAPDVLLLEAAQLLLERKYGCLPVVDDGELVGILTEADFVRLAIRQLSAPQ